MPIRLPPRGKATDAEHAEEVFVNAADYYNVTDTIERFSRAVASASALLKENKHSTDEFGYLVEGHPWLPMPSFSDDEAVHDIRRSKMRGRAYGHGMKRLLDRMIEEEVIGHEARKFIPELNDFKSVALFDELADQLLWNDKPMSLGKLCEIYGVQDITKSGPVRDKRLVRLTTFGIVTVRKLPRSYQIGPGPVLKAFYYDAYKPALASVAKAVIGRTFIRDAVKGEHNNA
jgi:hypothetical protein